MSTIHDTTTDLPAPSRFRSIHPDHVEIAAHGLRCGVTWKGRNYATTDWELSTRVKIAIGIATELGLTLADAFDALRQLGERAGESEIRTALFTRTPAGKRQPSPAPRAVTCTPARRPRLGAQLWEPCERCGNEPSYMQPNGHLCERCA